MPPSLPLNSVILTDDFHNEDFLILLTWDSQEQSTYFIIVDTSGVVRHVTVASYSNTSTYIFIALETTMKQYKLIYLL